MGSTGQVSAEGLTGSGAVPVAAPGPQPLPQGAEAAKMVDLAKAEVAKPEPSAPDSAGPATAPASTPPYPPYPYPPYYHPHYAYPHPGFPPPPVPKDALDPVAHLQAAQPHPAYAPWYYPPPPPYYPPYPTPPVAAPPKSAAEVAANAHNQRLLVIGIIAAIGLVHLPWLTFLFAMHGCWGGFIDTCFAAAPTDADGLSDTPFLFARVAFFILRVQTLLAVDFQQFSQILQVGTGLGSFALTKIVAANGTVVQGNLQRYGLAMACALAFVVLFWAELTLSSTATWPILGDETVLGYIDSELPADFVGASEAKAGLMKYLQFLRLADALIFGAALAMPKSPRQDVK